MMLFDFSMIVIIYPYKSRIHSCSLNEKSYDYSLDKICWS